MNPPRGFASDNNAGVHPEVFKAMEAANVGHAVAYGDDLYTTSAEEILRKQLGDIKAFFVFGGTGANVLGLRAITRPHQAIVCSSVAHIDVDECGAPENFTGCKLLPIPSDNGKITVEQIAGQMHGVGDQHHVQPRVVSLTQATEYGTVYTPREIKKVTDFAHENGLLVHMDGARIANAAAHLGVGLREITGDVGIDVLSFGGAKNGIMYGEAVVFFDVSLADGFVYIRKQGMQLPSKMRYIAVQLEALLSNGLWLRNAGNANKMARCLKEKLWDIRQVHITQEVESNAVFATIPKPVIPLLQQKYFFYVWNEEKGEVRFMTSFDHTEEDVDNFVKCLADLLRS